MLSLPRGLLPESTAFGVGAWAVFSFLVTGPEIGARVAKVDYYPACHVHHVEFVRKAAEAERQALPALDTGDDVALDYTENLMRNPMMQQLGELGGFGDAMDQRLQQLRAKREAAKETYERTMADIKASTRRKLANGDGFCGCVADAAIENSRNDWALFAGSFGVIKTSKIRNFGEAMTQSAIHGSCAGTAKESGQ